MDISEEISKKWTDLGFYTDNPFNSNLNFLGILCLKYFAK